MKSTVSDFSGALGKGFTAVGNLSKDAAHKVAKGTQKVLIDPTKQAVKQTNKTVVQPIQKAVVKGADTVVVKPSKAVGKHINHAANKVSEGTQKVIVEPAKAVAHQTSKQMKVITDNTAKAVSNLVPSSFMGATTKKAIAAPLTEGMALPPDGQILNMDVILTKQLGALSPNDWFTKFWLNTKVYEEFYRAADKQDIVISEWEEGETINPYDEESYTHRRTVHFHFDKTILGQKLSPQVSTVEHARVSEDRCIVTAATDCIGVPFGDAFQVHIRWVGTRIGQNDLLLQLGLFVLFKKSVMVAGQIRSASRSETIEAQTAVFEAMKEACGSQESTAAVALPGEDVNENRVVSHLCNIPPLNIFGGCAPSSPPERAFQDDLDRQIFDIRNMLQTLSSSPLIEEQRNVIQTTFELVDEALDEILVRKLDLEDTYQSSESEKNKGKKSHLKAEVVKSITSPVEQINSVLIRPIAKFSKKARKVTLSSFLKPSSSRSNKKGVEESTVPSDPSLDKGLQSMNVVVSKFFYNTTMDDVYDTLLARQRIPGSEPLYETMMRNSDMVDIEIGEWEEKGRNERFVDPWSKESYDYKRAVSFKMPRMFNSFLTSKDSPALLRVKQTQYYRKEARKLVLATTAESKDASFFSSVKTFRRLVVSQLEGTKLSFKVGIFVMFSRSEMLASKIRAQETQETRRVYTELYRAVRASQPGDGVYMNSRREKFEFRGIKEEKPPFLLDLTEKLRRSFRFSFVPLLQDDSELNDKIRAIRGKLKLIDEVLDDREGNILEDLNFYSDQLLIAREALDSLMTPSL